MEFCRKHPDLINFLENKIDVKMQNQYFLDIKSFEEMFILKQIC